MFAVPNRSAPTVWGSVGFNRRPRSRQTWLTLMHLTFQIVTPEKYEVKGSVQEAAIILNSCTEPKMQVTITLTSPVIREETGRDGGREPHHSLLHSSFLVFSCSLSLKPVSLCWLEPWRAMSCWHFHCCHPDSFQAVLISRSLEQIVWQKRCSAVGFNVDFSLKSWGKWQQCCSVVFCSVTPPSRMIFILETKHDQCLHCVKSSYSQVRFYFVSCVSGDSFLLLIFSCIFSGSRAFAPALTSNSQKWGDDSVLQRTDRWMTESISVPHVWFGKNCAFSQMEKLGR